MKPDGGRPTPRPFRPWGWFWGWCVTGAAAALAIGGTPGFVFLAVFAVGAMFLYAVIARPGEAPRQPRRVELPEAGSAPLVFVLRGRNERLASLRLAAMAFVELAGEDTWSLDGLEWYRTYAVRIPPGHYEMRLFDPRGRSGRGNREFLDMTLIPDGRLYVEYRRGWSLLPTGSLRWQPSVPDGVAVDEVINARKERRR